MATQAATAARQFWDGANPAAQHKRTLALLDPTKMGTWQIVRRPPIEKGAVIQGLVRARNSNAFKTHQWKEGVRLKKALSAVTHGKNIFVYHNIRTNQVVYSLTRYLEVSPAFRYWIVSGY
jgi:hypothetical protein